MQTMDTKKKNLSISYGQENQEEYESTFKINGNGVANQSTFNGYSIHAKVFQSLKNEILD